MVALIALFFCGCGAVPDSSPPDATVLFINETSASNSALMQQWTTAQQNIAVKPSDMNPVTRLLVPGTPAVTIQQDPRALTVLPRGLKVVAVPDISISQLVLRDPAWGRQSDPSGVIDCGAKLLAHSCVDIQANTVYSASSLIPQALEWEFENVILNSLGYDVSGR